MVAMDLSKNVMYNSHNGHIEVPYFEYVTIENKLRQLKKIDTCKNPFDMVTRALPRKKMSFVCRNKLQVVKIGFPSS